MSKILFITTRNICTTCGELRLIKNRGIVLKDGYGIETDVCSYISEKKMKKRNETTEFESEIFVTYKKNPVDIILKYIEFEKRAIELLEKENYSAVVVSGAFLSNIAKKIKNKKKIYTVYDSHGAWDELKEFNKNIFKWFKYLFLTHIEKGILNYSDGAFVVTDSLRKHLKKRYGWKKDTFIVPCATEGKEYSFAEAKKLRDKWRAEFGINEDEILFVYSGGVSPWQSIDEAYDIFKSYKAVGGNAKFLIMTPNADKIAYDDAIVRTFSPEQVEEVLFAGDIAMLIRGNFITNKVAFPNKYLEYVKSNMFIIATPYISEISKEITDTATGMIINNNSDFVADMLKTKYENKEALWEDFEKRKEIVKKYRFKNTIAPFAEKIKSKT